MGLSIQLKNGHLREQTEKHCHAWMQVQVQQCLKGTQKQLPVVPQALFCGSSEPEKQKSHTINNMLRINTSPKPFSGAATYHNEEETEVKTSVAYPGIQVKTLVHSRTQLNPCPRCGMLCRIVQHSLSVKNVSCICSLNPTRTVSLIL